MDNINNIVEKQREYFYIEETKNINFRITQLKRLKQIIIKGISINPRDCSVPSVKTISYLEDSSWVSMVRLILPGRILIM